MTTCLITGASGGIGRAIVHALKEDGINVIGVGRKPDGNTKCDTYIRADLTKSYDMQRIFALVPQVDILINCAGIFPYKPLSEFSYTEIENAFLINAMVPIGLCRFYLPYMIEQKKGYIINIGSTSAYEVHNKNHTIYAATKGAMLSFARALDEEARGSGVRVHYLAPASVDTPLVRDTGVDVATMLTPREVADTVMFLLKYEGNGIINELTIRRFNR